MNWIQDIAMDNLNKYTAKRQSTMQMGYRECYLAIIIRIIKNIIYDMAHNIDKITTQYLHELRLEQHVCHFATLVQLFITHHMSMQEAQLWADGYSTVRLYSNCENVKRSIATDMNTTSNTLFVVCRVWFYFSRCVTTKSDGLFVNFWLHELGY